MLHQIPPLDRMAPAGVVATCLAMHHRERPYREFGWGLEKLARLDGCLVYRLAMVLACVKRMDVTELGYTSFKAFCREEACWGSTWCGQLIGLIESDLDLIKRATCRGAVPFRLAALAPRHVAVDEQDDWLFEQTLPPRTAPRSTTLRGGPAKVVRRARALMRLLIGSRAPDSVVDAAILQRWRDQVPAAQILAEAREDPDPPEHGPLSFDWHEGGDPTESLLGPWQRPTTLQQAVEQIRALLAARRGRKPLLARAWVVFDAARGWQRCGFDSARAFARHRLGWSARTLDRRNALGRVQLDNPAIERALREGLDPGRAELIGTVVDGDAVDWLALSARVGRLELQRAVQDAQRDGTNAPTLTRYQRAIAAADDWQAGEAVAPTEAGAPTAGEADAPTAGEADASTAGEADAPTAGEADAPAAGEADAPTAGEADAPTAGEAGASTAGEAGASTAGEAGASTAGDHYARGPASDPRGAARVTGQPGPPGTVLLVALPHPEPEPSEAPLRVHPQLLEASRWLLATVRVPIPPGVAGRVKLRDGFRCINPECGLRVLRTHVHHHEMRSQGGSDDEVNLGTLCPACHLRGIHAKLPDGRARIQGDRVVVAGRQAVLWTYPDGRRVLGFREQP